MDSRFIFVALGNPADKYAETRHNAGRWLLQSLIADNSLKLKRGIRVKGSFVKFNQAKSENIFYVPAGYINQCGQPIARTLRYFDLTPQQLIVLHDDLDFNPGELRFKVGGGHGGHNGLRDIISHLGTSDFMRVRIGIGRPGWADQQASANSSAQSTVKYGEARVDKYVLSRPPAVERSAINNIIQELTSYQQELGSGNLDELMRIFHTD